MNFLKTSCAIVLKPSKKIIDISFLKIPESFFYYLRQIFSEIFYALWCYIQWKSHNIPISNKHYHISTLPCSSLSIMSNWFVNKLQFFSWIQKDKSLLHNCVPLVRVVWKGVDAEIYFPFYIENAAVAHPGGVKGWSSTPRKVVFSP